MFTLHVISVSYILNNVKFSAACDDGNAINLLMKLIDINRQTCNLALVNRKCQRENIIEMLLLVLLQ